MGRVTGALFTQPDSTAYSAGHQNAMLDLQYGGQMGYSPVLAEWVSNQQYVRHNLIPILVEAPKGFTLLPDGQEYITTLRALIELHAISITGLQAGLTVEVAETPVGGAGQQQQDPTDVKMERSNPVFRFNEKYGMPVTAFFRSWINNLIMDENSKFANLATTGTTPTDMLADMYSCTILFIEPDPTMTQVVQSWLGTNMYPLGTGEVTGARDLTVAGETRTSDINFTGIFQYGLGVDLFAQQILSQISLSGANPENQQAFISAIDPAVTASTGVGYEAGITTLAANAVQV
jgi:hypothetical protein